MATDAMRWLTMTRSKNKGERRARPRRAGYNERSATWEGSENSFTRIARAQPMKRAVPGAKREKKQARARPGLLSVATA